MSRLESRPRIVSGWVLFCSRRKVQTRSSVIWRQRRCWVRSKSFFMTVWVSMTGSLWLIVIFRSHRSVPDHHGLRLLEVRQGCGQGSLRSLLPQEPVPRRVHHFRRARGMRQVPRQLPLLGQRYVVDMSRLRTTYRISYIYTSIFIFIILLALLWLMIDCEILDLVWTWTMDRKAVDPLCLFILWQWWSPFLFWMVACTFV